MRIRTAEEVDNFFMWLSGFIDGRGCFYFHTKNGFSPPQFQLKLRADNADVLLKCCLWTGLGRIKTVNRNKPSKTQCLWIIDGREECLELVKILGAYPLISNKAEGYKIWSETVILWQSQKKRGTFGRGTTGYQDADRIEELHQKLKASRVYNGGKNACN